MEIPDSVSGDNEEGLSRHLTVSVKVMLNDEVYRSSDKTPGSIGQYNEADT